MPLCARPSLIRLSPARCLSGKIERGVDPTSVYVDTSALAKWYLPEARSDDVEEYLRQVCPVYISLLTKAEIKSVLARRWREGHIDAETQGKILATFEGDIAMGHLILLPYTVDSFLVAESLLGSGPDIPLRTLDALHLGVMRSSGVNTLATADRTMMSAAKALGIECEAFL
jgi:predicted nucleic acid-binding protein